MRIAGIDFGDERVTAVTVDESGTIAARWHMSSRTEDLASTARDAYQAITAAGGCDVLGVTLPFHADAVPAEISRELNTQHGRELVALNGGQAIALAEAWSGGAIGCRNVVAFSIGDHVTAGVLLDGRVLTGHNGHAASVAWLALNPVEREDYRRYGGLEAEVAAVGIVRRLVWRIKSGDQSRVIERVDGDLSRLTAADVFAAARAGDGVCLSVVRDTAKYVGMALANLATVVDPECIVLSGTLATSGDLMLDAIRTECSRRLRPAQADNVSIVLGTLGDEAAAIGAARAAMLRRQ
jgi:glucokinase